ncbi:hypothetical protein OQY15_01120 [Pedobacter sp. MC2016-15]|uniref:hypothetical protein n=1 Tax=Pedobacter sp. MC2016-15 TaxID=2994473 RepID=UPI0022458341|nr:hypothetical protein [Pedobacter sp. MC2016-15]MCX2477668.1 hypothetical protein [Pedobacter sp. MC2016-15]
MNQRLQQKIEQYKQVASSKAVVVRSVADMHSRRSDSLGSVIRSKKDADVFMSELESIIKRNK